MKIVKPNAINEVHVRIQAINVRSLASRVRSKASRVDASNDSAAMAPQFIQVSTSPARVIIVSPSTLSAQGPHFRHAAVDMQCC